MASIDLQVVRDGKWVSECDTTAMPGEPCVHITDAPGQYGYSIETVPTPSEFYLTINDLDHSQVKERKFNEELKERGLPPYFKTEKG